MNIRAWVITIVVWLSLMSASMLGMALFSHPEVLFNY